MNRRLEKAVVKWADAAVHRMPSCSNENQVKQYLVLPFFELLGYNHANPDEVQPEAPAGNGKSYAAFWVTA